MELAMHKAPVLATRPSLLTLLFTPVCCLMGHVSTPSYGRVAYRGQLAVFCQFDRPRWLPTASVLLRADEAAVATRAQWQAVGARWPWLGSLEISQGRPLPRLVDERSHSHGRAPCSGHRLAPFSPSFGRRMDRHRHSQGRAPFSSHRLGPSEGTHGRASSSYHCTVSWPHGAHQRQSSAGGFLETLLRRPPSVRATGWPVAEPPLSSHPRSLGGC